MGTNSAIEWTDTTWNPLAGCTWASPGCDHCYAAVMARRLEAMALADIAAGRDPGQKRKYIGITNKNRAGRVMFNGRVNLDEAAIDEPLRWKRPRRVFVNSMSDLFHKDVPEAFIRKVWRTMLATPQHTYQVLTKRPERMADVVTRLVEEDWDKGLPKAYNIWLGTSVENQEQADARIPHLLRVPAAVRFLSCEPLLGLVDLTKIKGGDDGFNALNPDLWQDEINLWRDTDPDWRDHFEDWYGVSVDSTGPMHARIDWVIVGGESGHGARPMHPKWARSLRDQCSAAGVAFFFKQWGEYKPAQVEDDPHFTGGRAYNSARGGRSAVALRERSNKPFQSAQWRAMKPGDETVGGCVMLDEDTIAERVGKHAAGRELDGQTWNEMPTQPTTQPTPTAS